MTPPEFVCVKCGHEQATDNPCEACRSVRVVLVKIICTLFGENWRACFTLKETP